MLKIQCYFFLPLFCHTTFSFFISKIKGGNKRKMLKWPLCTLGLFHSNLRPVRNTWKGSLLPVRLLRWTPNVFPHKKIIDIWGTCEFNQNSAYSGLYLQICLQLALFIWKWRDWIPSVHYSRSMTLTESFRTSPEDIFSYCSARMILLDINKSFVFIISGGEQRINSYSSN